MDYKFKTSTCLRLLAGEQAAQLPTSKLEAFLDDEVKTSGLPVVILADHFPEQGDIDLLLEQQTSAQMHPSGYILVLTDKKTRYESKGWLLLDHGCEDVLQWEGEDELIGYLRSRQDRNETMRKVLESPWVCNNLVGKSPVWHRFLNDVTEAAMFSSAAILLIGESGTGKEMISQLIHNIDPRPDKKKLVIVDCTTIVPELSGSELFGHERGSYTNAIQSREGAVTLANGGTLFLDEIGELPLTLQAELLRVLQEGTYKKVGSNNWQKTSFRLVCATNKDLRKAVAEGKFRQDLYYRIADCEYQVPPLRKRKDDIPALVNFFLRNLFGTSECPEMDKPVMDYLLQKEYPGNIRELKQLVRRIALKHVNHRKITIGEVSATDRIDCCQEKQVVRIDGLESLIRKALLTGQDWWLLKNQISESAIQVALDLENNNKQKAAARLGVDVRTVQQYVKKKGSGTVHESAVDALPPAIVSQPEEGQTAD